MDTRYSTEQRELRAATAALLADLGPRTVADLDDTARQARLAAAAASSGWFELRGPGEGDAPLASGVEVAIVARELGRVAADTAFLGPVVAVDLARQAGLELADAGTSAVFEVPLCNFAVVATSGAVDGVAVDCAGATRGLVLTAADEADDRRLVEVPLADAAPATDLTRALARVVLDDATALPGAAIAGAAVERSRALALTIT